MVSAENESQVKSLLLKCLTEIDTLQSCLPEVIELRNNLINQSEKIFKKPVTFVLIGNSEEDKYQFLNDALAFYSKDKIKGVFESVPEKNLSIKLVDNSDNPQFHIRVSDTKEKVFNQDQVNDVKEVLKQYSKSHKQYVFESIKVPDVDLPFKLLSTPNLCSTYFDQSFVEALFKAHLPIFVLLSDEKTSFLEGKCKIAMTALNKYSSHFLAIGQQGRNFSEEFYSSLIKKDYCNIRMIGSLAMENNEVFWSGIRAIEAKVVESLRIYHSTLIFNHLVDYFHVSLSEKYLNSKTLEGFIEKKPSIKEMFSRNMQEFYDNIPRTKQKFKEYSELYDKLRNIMAVNENKIKGSLNRKDFIKANIDIVEKEVQTFFQDKMFQIIFGTLLQNEYSMKVLMEWNEFKRNPSFITKVYDAFAEKERRKLDQVLFVPGLKEISIKYKFGSYIGFWKNEDARINALKLIFYKINEEIENMKDIATLIFDEMFCSFVTYNRKVASVYNLVEQLKKMITEWGVNKTG